MIGADDARYALAIVETICAQVGPGLPGSPQERARAAILQKELAAHLGEGNVVAEEFTLAPWAFLSAFPIGAFLLLLAVLFNITTGRLTGVAAGFSALAALAFSIIAPLPFILLFVLNIELVDPFLGQRTSVNVVGTLCKPGMRAVKRLLILSGHHDSASENTWIGLLGRIDRWRVRNAGQVNALEGRRLRILGGLFYLVQATPLLGYVVMLLVSAIQLAGVFTGRAGLIRLGTLDWILLAYPLVPAIVYGLFLNRGKKGGGTVPGAADNLSACAVAVALCRFLVDHPEYIPADTEIRFITFGSEEAGMRGSRRYVERHREELKRLDVRLLNVETIAHRDIVILSSEASGTVKNSPAMVKSVVAAARRAGVPHKVQPAFIGVAGDAGPFSQAGLQATTLLCFKVPEQLVHFYHQPGDRPDVLTIEPLLNVLKLACEWIRAGGEADSRLETEL
jgi:hypothetical protein